MTSNSRWSAIAIGILATFIFQSTCSAGPMNTGELVTIDFTTDDSGRPLTHGQVISTLPDVQLSDSLFEFGSFVSISTSQGASGHLGAVIFDSTPGGPGETLGDPDVDLLVDMGNILTLQDPKSPNNTDTGAGANGLVFNNPDDVRLPGAGSILFEFVEPVAPKSVDIIDADKGVGGEVVLTDIFGNQRTYTIHPHWTFDISKDGPNGYATLLLDELAAQDAEGAGEDQIPGNLDDYATVVDLGLDDQNVETIEFRFLGQEPDGWSSFGIDNLVVQRRIPEPSTMALISLAGLVAIAARRRLNRK
ncbi:PEP-CTERM sorting domain-containing protein [Aeoliella sp. ICT_H6.2]|uniref:PEP-CTERM sorting domain-containing protein n=1 Tax=Aeoliella straminimaris TaxID=2954799 RepID=A0A9X2F5C4_9BACT|nr:PEP-CTERM sorting domain-containing protein [Aeoliella straminimaris]MCO6042542.1 PEP-CTERM sorting domain-containing protein [Aeoliella straminimaris]